MSLIRYCTVSVPPRCTHPCCSHLSAANDACHHATFAHDIKRSVTNIRLCHHTIVTISRSATVAATFRDDVLCHAELLHAATKRRIAYTLVASVYCQQSDWHLQHHTFDFGCCHVDGKGPFTRRVFNACMWRTSSQQSFALAVCCREHRLTGSRAQLLSRCSATDLMTSLYDCLSVPADVISRDSTEVFRGWKRKPSCSVRRFRSCTYTWNFMTNCRRREPSNANCYYVRFNSVQDIGGNSRRLQGYDIIN